MYYTALKMLMGDRSKYFGMVMGLTFASFIMTQQPAIFTGLMARTFSFITDLGQPDIWVMDPKVQFIDDIKPMQDTQLYRVRGVEGVEWAVPLYKGLLKARLENGNFQTCIVVGLDDATLIGGRPVPLKLGDVLELNDRRATVVGIARVTRTFQSQPVIYTTYTRAIGFAPRERKLLSFVLVKARAGEDLQALTARIQSATGLAAYTRDEFKMLTVQYFMKNTGIPINFGMAVLLGFIIGAAVAGQTFYNFTLDNLRQFGVLKAMGTGNGMLLRMILLQATVVGTIGWGLGVGAAALFGYVFRDGVLAFKFPWQLLVISGGAVTLICIFAALLSILKVIKLEPAIVFKT